MTQNKKYVLRKIGKRVCHVAMTVSTFAVAVTTVVSADEVVAPTDNHVTTTTEAPATPVTETPTTAAPTSETPAANPVTEAPTTATPVSEAPVTEAPTTATPVSEAPTTVAPVTEAPTTAAPVTEAPVTEAPATAAPVTEAPATNKTEKSTNIDELLRPETNQSAQITVTTQLHKGREGDIDSAPTGEPKVEKVSTTRSNADARVNAMVVDEVNKIQQSNNGNALELDGDNYRVSSYSVNTETRTVDGVQVLNYAVNVYTEHFDGNFDRRVHSYELTVADETGANVEEKHQTETGVEGLNTKEILADQEKYALGSIVENNGKSYRVVWNQQRNDKIDSLDSNADEEYINYGMEVRLKPIDKFPTEIIMFQINDDKGNVLRGPRRAEIVAGRAESIFNIGDKIVEGGKNYVVAGRSMSHAKEDLPTGEVQTFLYKITLKEDVPTPSEEKPSEEKPSTDAEKPSEDAPTTNVEQPSEEAPKPLEDVKPSEDVKPAQYVATVDYVVGGEIIKQAVVLNGSADNKDQADAQLNSQSNLMQAMLGKEFEMGGKKYKVKAVRDIQRENFDEDDKVRLSLKMVYDLEEVPAAEEPVEEYPRAEAPGTETEQPSEEAPKPSEEKPSEDVKPSEDAKPSEEAPKPSEEKPSEDAKPSEEAPKPSEEKPSENVKPSEEAPKEDKKAPSSEVKQEKVAPKQEAKKLPNTGVESLIGSLGAGLVALLGGLGLAIKKDRNN